MGQNSKTKNMRKKTSKGAKLKMWQLKNPKCEKKCETQNVTKLKNSKFDKTLKLKMWQNSKNSKCDKTQILKIWKIQKLKLWQN